MRVERDSTYEIAGFWMRLPLLVALLALLLALLFDHAAGAQGGSVCSRTEVTFAQTLDPSDSFLVVDGACPAASSAYKRTTLEEMLATNGLWMDTTCPGIVDTDTDAPDPAVATFCKNDDFDAVYLYSAIVNYRTLVTCTDSGNGSPGALTITPLTGYVALTNADADGCALTLSESVPVNEQGRTFELVVVSTAGGNVTLADSAGVQEAGAGCAMGLWGVMTARYVGDRWVLTNCRTSN